MKKYILMFIITILLLCIIPILALFSFIPQSKDNPSPKNAITISVYDKDTDKITEQNLEEYLVGVVAAEMPALYEVEALKAQAVAARSYILSRRGKENPDHGGADVCTDPAHCKAYISPQDANKKWGSEWSDKYLEKIRSAVFDTEGEYISYNGEAAVACFCAVSSGRTENAKDVWGGDTPYLRSVESPGDLSYDGFEASVSFSKEEALSRLGVSSLETKDISRTEGGSVKTISIGEKEFSGTQLRSLFGLNSANFEISLDGDSIIFTSKGKGHGVGMSQYGANKMAEDGEKYTEILLHYYSNVTIENLQKI